MASFIGPEWLGLGVEYSRAGLVLTPVARHRNGTCSCGADPCRQGVDHVEEEWWNETAQTPAGVEAWEGVFPDSGLAAAVGAEFGVCAVVMEGLTARQESELIHILGARALAKAVSFREDTAGGDRRVLFFRHPAKGDPGMPLDRIELAEGCTLILDHAYFILPFGYQTRRQQRNWVIPPRAGGLMELPTKVVRLAQVESVPNIHVPKGNGHSMPGQGHVRTFSEMAVHTSAPIGIAAIRPWVMAGSVSILAGRALSAGKTRLILHMMASLQHTSFLGIRQERLNVLYVSDQTDPSLLDSIDDAQIPLRQFGHVSVVSLAGRGPTDVDDLVRKWVDIAHTNQIRLVVLDSADGLDVGAEDEHRHRVAVARLARQLAAEGLGVLITTSSCGDDVEATVDALGPLSAAADTVMHLASLGRVGGQVRVLTAQSRHSFVPEQVHMRFRDKQYQAVHAMVEIGPLFRDSESTQPGVESPLGHPLVRARRAEA